LFFILVRDFGFKWNPFQAITRTFHEYPFLPSQSGIRSDVFGQINLPHLHEPMEGPARTPFPLGNEQQPRIHAPQSHSSRVRVLSQPQDKQVIPYPSPPQENDIVPKREPHINTTNTVMNSHYTTDHPIVGQEIPYALPGGQVSHNDAVLRMERKRKVLIEFVNFLLSIVLSFSVARLKQCFLQRMIYIFDTVYVD